MSQVQSRPALPSLHEKLTYSFDYQQDRFKPRESNSRSPRGAMPHDARSGNWEYSKPRSPAEYSARSGYDRPAQPSLAEMNQGPTQERLPSLSSLFGAAPPPPVQNGYPNRSPPFPTLPSPHERGPQTPGRQEMKIPGPTTYFQRPSTGGAQEYGRREFPERVGLPAPSRGVARPDSPRAYDRYSPYETSRPSFPTSGASSRWSPQSEPPSRQDYFLFSRDMSFRPPASPSAHSLSAPRDTESKPYRDCAPQPPSPSHYVTSSAPSQGSEPVVTKDSLGPKIWTGTQFLPRFVREAEVPGEGLCFFYDDGSHCKTVIDGEAVNAHWGVTKAGKPRKRLAIACKTCREKKIKCDPDYPRCLQCEKFGRTCRFQNAPRGGHGGPDTPPTEVDDAGHGSGSIGADGDAQQMDVGSQQAPSSPTRSVRHLTPESDAFSVKRRKTGPTSGATVLGEKWTDRPESIAPSSPRSPAATHSAVLESHPIVSNSAPEQLFREMQLNPAEQNPELVADLMAAYFTHMSSATYCMFAVKPFNEWLFNTRIRKSLDDLMLIYTILALASTFSQDQSIKSRGKRWAAVARYGADTRPYTVQLVQSRLLLSLYAFSNNNHRDSWDLVGCAIRASSKLKLNIELELLDEPPTQPYPLGLNHAGFAECRRRTFWCCYLVDRFNGGFNGLPSLINAEDVFLRLPCSMAAFDTQSEVKTPFFQPRRPPQVSGDESHEPEVGAMGYLVAMSTIWNDVMLNIYRHANAPFDRTRDGAWAEFYMSITQRLDEWLKCLPKFMQYSLANLHQTASANVVGMYTSTHVLYYLTLMKLNRYVCSNDLTASERQHHLRQAHNAACGLLDMVGDLAALSSFQNKGRNEFSTPLVGFGCISAVDIITCKLPVDLRILAEVRERFVSVRQVISEMARFWHSARLQRQVIGKRLDEVERLMDRQAVAHPKAGRVEFHAMEEPMEKIYPREDIVYLSDVGTWRRAIMAA